MLSKFLNKDIYKGRTGKDVAKYILVGYAIYVAAKYAYWCYRNSQVKAQARKIKEEKENRKYDFKIIPNEDEIIKMDVQ